MPRLAPPVVFALLASGLMAWQGMLTMAFTDYEVEAEPSLQALRAGHIGAFLAHLPAYGGSLILRAPFALLPSLWHGGSLALFRSFAVPCLLAAVALGLVLWSRLDRDGQRRAAWVALALCVLNPVTVRALEIGHPEDLLGACLCAAAVMAAIEERPTWAGILLGLALANKAWAVLAVLPVVLALRHGRARAAVIAGGAALLVLAPMLLSGASGVSTAASIGNSGAGAFHPWQVWWFFGPEHLVPHGTTGTIVYRVGPGWLAPISHRLVVLSCLPLAALWWWRRARPAGAAGRDALLLLSVVMLARCLLDPWNVVYYALPFLVALTAWEAFERRRLPVIAVFAALATWTDFELLNNSLRPDQQSVLYLLWTLPLFALLSWRLYAPASFARRSGPVLDAAGVRLPGLARLLQRRAEGVAGRRAEGIAGRRAEGLAGRRAESAAAGRAGAPA
ncbi:MAG TPA: glycosyltransferase family 87 protein [Solirubrobacteraceae bacterium]|nr:glycosyltransferase family 87 protein [Solirubrobacteraceae bacterium]